MITTFILFLLTYVVGYVAGHFSNKEQTEQAVSNLVKGTKKLLPSNTLKPGIIRRPSAEELNKRNRPQGVKESEDAMLETLDNIPELRELKDAVKKVVI